MVTRQRSGAFALGLAFFLWVAQVLGNPSSARIPAAEPLALGYSPLTFKPPVPGSYTLADLGPAGDAPLIDANGKPVMLRQLIAGRTAVISFIYSSCHETNGCPLATSVLQRVGQQLVSDAKILQQVTFLSISFDPVRDTPEVMTRYGVPFKVQGLDWNFLSIQDPSALKGMLASYQQTVTQEVDAQGRKTGFLSHLLRVFLVDATGHIRNSYTPSVLHPDLLVADIKTLAMNEIPTLAPSVKISADPTKPLRSGDNKNGYEDRGYATQSLSLLERKGRRADLLSLSKQAGLGLPQNELKVTAGQVLLGRKLFFDRRLSLNGTVSCAMCHIPEQGFASQEQSTAVGIEGRTVRRNAPTVLNVGHLRRLFHDGREFSLVNQVWGPLLASQEMGNPSPGRVIETIKAQSDYRGLFEKVFGRGPTLETVGEALAAYERVLDAGDSPFDQWFYGKKPGALTPDQQKGFALFTGKAGCSGCHPIDPKGGLLTDEVFHNTGIGYRQSMGGDEGPTEVQLAPGVKIKVDAAVVKQVSEISTSDLGRYEITLDPSDRWAYRTPGLRNVALTAPYMHNGSLTSLEAVIDFYDQGGYGNPGLDPAIHPLSLSRDEKKQLVLFLESLTGSKVNDLVRDAWAEAVGDPASKADRERPP